jgi:hypothetical protein
LDDSIDAGNGAQILINGAQIVIRHVLVNGPGHHLKHFAIERRQKACAIGISGERSSGGTIWMNVGAAARTVVVVLSRTHDREELLKRVASFGPPRLVWSQVLRVEMLKLSMRTEC